jgi:uncharacterized membrane protein YkoI
MTTRKVMLVSEQIRNVVLAVLALGAIALGAGAIAQAGNEGPTAAPVAAPPESPAEDKGEDAAEGPDKAIKGSALDKASAAALAYMGGGKVTGTEVGDEESYYEVEVTNDDGSQTDVQLDKSFDVVGSETDGAGDK